VGNVAHKQRVVELNAVRWKNRIIVEKRRLNMMHLQWRYLPFGHFQKQAVKLAGILA